MATNFVCHHDSKLCNSRATKSVEENIAREENIHSKIKAATERNRGNDSRMNVDDGSGESSPGTRKTRYLIQLSIEIMLT